MRRGCKNGSIQVTTRAPVNSRRRRKLVESVVDGMSSRSTGIEHADQESLRKGPAALSCNDRSRNIGATSDAFHTHAITHHVSHPENAFSPSFGCEGWGDSIAKQRNGTLSALSADHVRHQETTTIMRTSTHAACVPSCGNSAADRLGLVPSPSRRA